MKRFISLILTLSMLAAVIPAAAIENDTEVSENASSAEISEINAAPQEVTAEVICENADSPFFGIMRAEDKNDTENPFSETLAPLLADDTTNMNVADDWSWYIDGGVLIMNGHGAMPNWNYPNDLPLYLSKNITDVIINEGITAIGNYSFYGCSTLKTITLPQSLTKIGDSAFYGCKNINEVTLPKNIVSIGNSAFYNCTGLTYFTIQGNLTNIGWKAFYNCTGLKAAGPIG